MFTGIVEEKGVVQKIAKGVHCASLVIAAGKLWKIFMWATALPSTESA